MCWSIFYLYPVYLWRRWGKLIMKLPSQHYVCWGEGERELETRNKSDLQKIGSLSGWNLVHKKNYLWHLLSQRKQRTLSLKEGVIFILHYLRRAGYFLEMLQKCLLNNCSRNITETSLPGFSLYYLKQILTAEANA